MQKHPSWCTFIGSPQRDYTPRRIPLVCSRTVSPRPLPSCRCHSLRSPHSRSEEPLVVATCASDALDLHAPRSLLSKRDHCSSKDSQLARSWPLSPMRNRFPKTTVLSLPEESAFRSDHPPSSEEKTAGLLSPVCEAVFRRLQCTSCRSSQSHRRFFHSKAAEATLVWSLVSARMFWSPKLPSHPLLPLESRPRHLKLAARLTPLDTRFDSSKPKPFSPSSNSLRTPKCRREAPVVNPQSQLHDGKSRRPLQMARPSSADRASAPGSLASPHSPLPEAALSVPPEKQSPSRLCSADESVAPTDRFQSDRCPILPWVLFPSKVPYIPLPSRIRANLPRFRSTCPERPVTSKLGSRSTQAIPPLVRSSLTRKRARCAPPESVRSASSQGMPCRPSWGL